MNIMNGQEIENPFHLHSLQSKLSRKCFHIPEKDPLTKIEFKERE